MITRIILSTFIIFSAFNGICQQLPSGDCGIVYVYDAAGNRTKRIYFCNNGGGPYPSKHIPFAGEVPKAQPIIIKEEVVNAKQEESFDAKESANIEIQQVDALYPNPTSGIFYIYFYNKLENAGISILDMNGKLMQHFKTSGTKLTCDLSSLAAGMYLIRIEEKGGVITKKVIKL